MALRAWRRWTHAHAHADHVTATPRARRISARVIGPFMWLSVHRGWSSTAPSPECTSRTTNYRFASRLIVAASLGRDASPSPAMPSTTPSRWKREEDFVLPVLL